MITFFIKFDFFLINISVILNRIKYQTFLSNNFMNYVKLNNETENTIKNILLDNN